MTQYTSRNKRFCSVFKSLKKNGMYVYVDRKKGIGALPEELIPLFGKPEHVLDMILTPLKKLARVEAQKVLDEIFEKGYYLQMPPIEDEEKVGHHPEPKDSLHG